jgi:hypothetical protein
MTAPPPQEIIDEIIDNLDDFHDLLVCSMVAKSWIHRCRRHMFETCEVWSDNLDGWEGIRTIHPYIRRLALRRKRDTPGDLTTKVMFKVTQGFTPECDLRSLEVTRLFHDGPDPSLSIAFLPVSQTLRRLRLDFATMDTDSMLSLFFSLPLLEWFRIHAPLLPSNSGDDNPPRPLAQTPNATGTLELSLVNSTALPFLQRLAKLPLGYHTLVIPTNYCYFPYDRLIGACSSTLRTLAIKRLGKFIATF